MKEEPENHVLVSADCVKKMKIKRKKQTATLQNQKLGLKHISSSSSVLRQQVDSQDRNTLRRQRKEIF